MRVVMGSRSSPPTASTSSNISRPSQEIKKETQDDEIKEYAETAMNELLGWYGYDKVDRSDTQGLNLHHFAAQRSPSELDTSDESSSPGRRDASSSRDSPTPADPVSLPPDCTVCAWCTKVVNDKQLFSVKTPTGEKAFCSEVCFSQCRRANFKRNKTCDWCRHIRHTVNYVDFQDGEYQLQFCSDKCLNQYKMNIFCRETQAHLQMHPHLQDGGPAGGGVASSSGGLITPDLWLRDCRSVSPCSDRSSSPPPQPPQPPSPARSVTPEPTPTDRKMRLRRTVRRRTATITSPTDLRTNCSSPASGDEQYLPPKQHNNIPRLHPLPSSVLMPPMLHPPPRLFHPDPSRLPFMPHGMLPPPHIYADHPRFPMLRPPVRLSPPPTVTSRPPPLLPLPPRLPPARPSYHQPPPRSLLPPVTVMVPYPIIIPVPIPIPIPIPIFWPRHKLPEHLRDLGKPGGSDDKQSEKNGEVSSAEGPVAAFLRVTAPPPPVTLPTPSTVDVDEPLAKLPRQPLRKRKRLVEGKTDEDSLGKRKYVPV